ncbi:MAG TPA: serine/threonine-protein kinase [Candidatus Limnocylindria bacterium]|nr:serine/threonine-protein kinase [Candidatus Limnocylindria bacterium]
MATCEKCGTALTANESGGFCPRCMIADALGEEAPSSTDTSRFQNPFFHRSLGDYELLGEVARGGMGVIYKAKQRSLGRVVALKVLSSGEFASPEFVRRFQAEASAAARLQHPNIVAIHEVGEHDGIRYFTMDFVEGPNLVQLMAGRALAPGRAAGYLKTIAEAIQYAHQQGILHRDLKPSNVLVDPFGEPRVTDFGLAKELASDSELTITGQVLGTPGYLPPEQADSSLGPVTPASDVYSLGALLYYMLTARAPFVAGSMQETLRQLLSEDPVAPRLLNPEVPRDLETICLKCLERDQARRYGSAAALGEDLRRYLNGEPIAARPPSAVGRFTRWCRRRPALAAAWLLAVALAVGSTAAALLIARAQNHTNSALLKVQKAEAEGRERLRDARLAEARATLRTTLPGRRAKVLEAVRAAAAIRPGDDLQAEALAALLLPDVLPVESWNWNLGVPAETTFDPTGRIATLQLMGANGPAGGPANLRRWGDTNVLGHLEIAENNRAIGIMRFSPDGSLVMTRLLDDSVPVWRSANGSLVLTLTNQAHPGGEMQTESFNDDYGFTPDGRFILVGQATEGVTLFRIPDGNAVAHWASTNRITSLRIAPNGRYVALANISEPDYKRVTILELPDLKPAHEIELAASFSGFTWTQDGNSLAILSSDSAVGIYNMRDGHLERRIVCPGGSVGELVYIGNDQLLAFRGRGTALRVLSVATGMEELAIGGYGPSSMAPSPDRNTFITVALDGTATRRRYLPPVGLATMVPPFPDGVEMGLNACCLDFTPDGRWMVSSHGRYTFIRETATGRVVDMLDGGNPQGIEFSTVVFTEKGTRLLRLSTRTGLRRHQLILNNEGAPHIGPAEDLDRETGWVMADRSKEGARMVLVGPFNDRVKVIDVDADGVHPLSRWEAVGVSSGALSPDGTQVLINCAAAGNQVAAMHLRLHQVSDGAVLKDLPAPVSSDVSWSPQGDIALTSNGQGQSILWNTVTWERRAVLTGPLGGDMTTFTLEPTGSFAVITRDESVYLIEPNGRVRGQIDLRGTTGLAAGIRFLPDGRRFAILWRDGRTDVLDPEAMRAGLKEIGLGW